MSKPHINKLYGSSCYVCMFVYVWPNHTYIYVSGFQIYARYQNGQVLKWPPLHMAQIFATDSFKQADMQTKHSGSSKQSHKQW